MRRVYWRNGEPYLRTQASWSCFGYFEPAELKRIFGFVRSELGRAIAKNESALVGVVRGNAVALFPRADCPFVRWYWRSGEDEPQSFDALT